MLLPQPWCTQAVHGRIVAHLPFTGLAVEVVLWRRALSGFFIELGRNFPQYLKTVAKRIPRVKFLERNNIRFDFLR